MIVLADPEGSVLQDSTRVCISPGFGWIWTPPSCKVDPPCIHLVLNWDLPRGRRGGGAGGRREPPGVSPGRGPLPVRSGDRDPRTSDPEASLEHPFFSLCCSAWRRGMGSSARPLSKARLHVLICSEVGVSKHCLCPPCPSLLGQVWGAHSLREEWKTSGHPYP